MLYYVPLQAKSLTHGIKMICLNILLDLKVSCLATESSITILLLFRLP